MPHGPRVSDLLRQRMANQGLSARADGDARAATVRSGGIQAQDLWASRLAVRARARDVGLSGVIAATQAPAVVVRSWLMRGTLHMVAADDLRWLTGLFGPRIEAMFRRRHADLGLSPELLDRVGEILPAILRGTALTRAVLVDRLRDAGIAVPPGGPSAAHLTLWASARGLICRGAEIRSEPTYVLVDDWVPAGPDLRGDDALIELSRRYFRAFGPASVEDLAAWSRLPLGPIRRAVAALEGELATLALDGRPNFVLEPAATSTRVLRLLPAFDSYVLGYRRRALFLDPARHTDVLHGGMIYPMIVLDGAIIGTWRLARAVESAAVTAEFFTDVRPWVTDALHAEVADIGRFLDRTCTVRVAGRIGQPWPGPRSGRRTPT